MRVLSRDPHLAWMRAAEASRAAVSRLPCRAHERADLASATLLACLSDDGELLRAAPRAIGLAEWVKGVARNVWRSQCARETRRLAALEKLRTDALQQATGCDTSEVSAHPDAQGVWCCLAEERARILQRRIAALSPACRHAAGLLLHTLECGGEEGSWPAPRIEASWRRARGILRASAELRRLHRSDLQTQRGG